MLAFPGPPLPFVSLRGTRAPTRFPLPAPLSPCPSSQKGPVQPPGGVSTVSSERQGQAYLWGPIRGPSEATRPCKMGTGERKGRMGA